MTCFPRNTVTWFAVHALTLLAVNAGFGCGPAPAAPAAPSSQPATAPVPAAPAPAAPAAPQQGGVLTYASTTGINNMHPFKQRGAGERRTGGPVYDLLLSYKFEAGSNYEVNYEVVPWLAERWEQPDPTTYLLHLRKGVKWHDGEPFTAGDVVFSYQFIRDPANTFPLASLFAIAQSIEKVDDYTVRIVTKGATPFLLQRLADLNMFIVPKHVVERGDDLNKVAIGTGPFKLKSLDPASKNEYTRNPDYWRAGKPYLDGLVVHWKLDEASRLAAVIARELDIWTAPDKKQAENVAQTTRDVVVTPVTPGQGEAVLMRLDRPPFNDIRVRRAVHLALDRDGLVKTAANGEGTINPPGVPGHKQGFAIAPEELMKLPGYRQPKDQDLAEAKRLLAEAGYPSGLKATLLYGRDRSTEARLAEPVADSLRRGGIEITLGGRTQPEVLKALQEGSFEAALDLTHSMLPNERLYLFMHSKGSRNTFGLADPNLDRILESIDVATSSADQKRLALELQRHLLDNLYLIPTIEFPAYEIQQPWVRGLVMHQSVGSFVDQVNSTTTWFDQEVRKRYKS